MSASRENPYSLAFRPAQFEPGPRIPIEVSDVTFARPKCLDQELAVLRATGHRILGRSEFVLRNDFQGISYAANEFAAAIGAHVVIVEWTSAKVRAIQFGADGRIDMELVLADPPKSLQPRGHCAVRAVFLAKVN